MDDEILLDVDGPVARLRFNRPDLGNAVTAEQATALCAQLGRLVADPTVRVVVLTGSGRTFNVGASGRPGTASPGSAGPGSAGPASAAQRYRAQIPVMTRVIELLATSRLVSIAAINGGCAGAGLAVALACDLRYASRSARFSTGFLAAGLPGELGAAWFATRLVGAGRARELFLLPDRTDADALERIGMINRVVEPDHLDTVVADVAGRIAGFGPAALAAMKADLTAAADGSLAQCLRVELDGMLGVLAERDAVTTTEGASA